MAEPPFRLSGAIERLKATNRSFIVVESVGVRVPDFVAPYHDPGLAVSEVPRFRNACHPTVRQNLPRVIVLVHDGDESGV
jgi:hypothetical protein